MGDQPPPAAIPPEPVIAAAAEPLWPPELQQEPPPTRPPVQVTRPPKILLTRRLSLALFRLALYGVVAGLVVYSVVSTNLDQLRAENAQLTGQIATQQQQIDQLQATVDDLRQRWIGDPALWQPTGLPSDAVVQYFDVKGTTQADLIQSLSDAGLCAQYHCLPDPAVPANSAAWALENDGSAVPSAPYCYTPRSVTYHWAQHVILMPRWNPTPGSVKITLVQEWNALESAMLTHEIGHVNIADAYLVTLNQQSQQQPTCEAMNAFWQNPHVWDGLGAAQNDYHAKLRADCRPEIGCIPAGWMGW